MIETWKDRLGNDLLEGMDVTEVNENGEVVRTIHGVQRFGDSILYDDGRLERPHLQGWTRNTDGSRTVRILPTRLTLRF